MKIKLSIKNQSVILTWLLSYLIFLILFLVVTLLIYFRTQKTIRNEINNANTFMLNSVQTNMDNVLENIKKISIKLSYDNNIQRILYLKGELKSPDYFDVYRISSDIKSYISINNSINNIYILFKDYDKIITIDGIFNLKDFYRNNYSGNDSDFTSWLNEFTDPIPEKYFSMYTDKAHGSYNKLNYVRALSQVQYSNLSFSSGIVLNEKMLIQQLNDIDGITKGTSFIIDSKNNIIASSSPINLSDSLNFKDLSAERGVLYRYIDSKKVVISYISSKQADWKYVSIIPESVYFHKLTYIQNFTLWGLTLSFLLSGLLIYYFLKKNYIPVSNLLGILRDKTKVEETNSNEYILIENAIQQTLKDNYLINNELLNQKAVLKSNFFEKLLKGTNNAGIPLNEGLSYFNIAFESDYFAVVSFFIDDSINDIKTLKDYYDFNVLNFILSNITAELVNKKNKAFIIEVDNTVCCLVNFCQDRIFFAKSDMLNAMAEAQEFINKYYKINISCSISSIHENIESIPTAYNESLYAMNYKNIMSIKQNVCYDDINTDEFNNTYYYPLSQEHQLLNYIKSGNYAMARELIDGVFSKNLQSGMTIELAQCLMLNMVSTMIRAVNEISSVEKDTFLEGLNPITKLLHCKTINEMKKQLDSFLKEFCSHVSQTIEKSSNWVVSSIIPYLEKNFSNPNLGLDQIGEEFDLHPVYISKVFKEQVGEGLLDYITKLRIEHAKILLKENKEDTVEKIAELVGYTNVRTFSRVFKKYVNVSPGKYRDDTA